MSARGRRAAPPTKTPAPDRTIKGQLATRAAMLISGGKFVSVAALRKADPTSEFSSIGDDVIYSRLRDIRKSDELVEAAKQLVVNEEVEEAKRTAATLRDMDAAGTADGGATGAAGRWAAISERTDQNKTMRRKLSFKYCIARYSECVRNGQTAMAPTIARDAANLFGEDVKWDPKSIKAGGDKHAALKLTLDSLAIPSPTKMGRPTYYPPAAAATLSKFIKLLRLNKLPVFRESVIYYAAELIKGTIWEVNFLDENGKHCATKWRRWYYEHFKSADDVSTGAQRPLDARRARWGTAENMNVHYDNLRDALLIARIGTKNPKYNPDDKDADGVPKEPELCFDPTRTNRVVSMDESRINKSTTGGDGARKGMTERSVRMGADDDGECIASKAPGTSFSAAGGSNMAFEGLRAFFVLAKETIDVESLLGHLPVTMLMGHPVSGDVACNTKGAMTGDLMIKYVRTCVEPYVGEPVSKENPAVFICDGVGVHLTVEFLEYMITKGWLLVLRTPYCSEKQQVEDLFNFWKLKNAAVIGVYRAKQSKLGEVYLKSGGRRQELTDVELLDCAKPAWESAFSRQSCEIAWRMAGLFPFTRRPYWIQYAKEQKAKAVTGGLVSSGATELNLSALTLPGMKRHQPNSPDADGDDAADNADGDDAAEASGKARLTAVDLAMLPGGPMSEHGIMLTKLKAAIGDIKKLDADTLKQLLNQKGKQYKGVNHAKLEVMEITASEFADKLPFLASGVPLAWLPKDLKALKAPAAADAAPAPANGKVKKKAAFAWGAARAGANRLASVSAGTNGAP